MSFQQGLSGLNGAAKSLDVIGNNIANASTVGFKGSQAQFADVYANSLSGAGGNQAGIGTKVSQSAQQTGYQVGPNGTLLAGSPAPIQINTADLKPVSTTAIKTQLNLDSREANPVKAT